MNGAVTLPKLMCRLGTPAIGAQLSVTVAGIEVMRLKSFHAVFRVPLFREAPPSASARRALILVQLFGRKIPLLFARHPHRKRPGASRPSRLPGAGRLLEVFKALQRRGSPVLEVRKAVVAWAEVLAVDRMAVAVVNGKGCMKRTFLFLVGVSLLSWSAIAAQEEHFSSSDEAVKALRAAADDKDTNALAAIFGPALRGLISADPVQASNGLAVFSRRMSEKVVSVKESGSKIELEIGYEAWPFPIPLVSDGGQWYFDTVAGQEEILNRRVGQNELDTLRVCNAYVDAQRQVREC